MEKLFLYTDGGSRNNPGQAAIGVVLMDNEKTVIKLGKKIGIATNNIAEYSALIFGIETALKYQPKELICFMDSELAVKQLTGAYKIKNAELQKLAIKVKNLENQFEKVQFKYIPREQNSMADSLVNAALDNLL
ncbi:MAG: ribonuclease HI family protein [Patescibacteria group bacterium]|nr:ribonuclease HI family protein [Patescibacteria group bacterium]